MDSRPSYFGGTQATCMDAIAYAANGAPSRVVAGPMKSNVEPEPSLRASGSRSESTGRRSNRRKSAPKSDSAAAKGSRYAMATL